MRTVTRIGAIVMLIAAGFGVGGLRSIDAGAAVAIRSDVSVLGGGPEQVQMVRWAVGRFETAGLEAPPMEIRFHGDAAGCGGHLGYARSGRVDVCTTLVNVMARRNLLHEMSHVWLDENVDSSVKEAFLAMRDLTSWNDSNDPWGRRGYEQAAEIIAWCLGERILTPSIPDNDPEQMAVGYELLTGRSLPPAAV